MDLIGSIGALAPTLAYHLVPGLLLSFVGTGRSRALSTVHGLMDRLSRRKAFYEMYKVVQMCCVAGLYDVPDKHLPRLLACDVSDRVVFWLQAVQLAASAENGLKEQLSTTPSKPPRKPSTAQSRVSARHATPSTISCSRGSGSPSEPGRSTTSKSSWPPWTT